METSPKESRKKGVKKERDEGCGGRRGRERSGCPLHLIRVLRLGQF